MEGLPHDRVEGAASPGGRRREPGAERVPGEVAVETGRGGARRHDVGQRPIRERQPKVPVAIDPAKDAPLANRRRVEPAAQRPDWTRRFFSSKRDSDGAAGAFAIGVN